MKEGLFMKSTSIRARLLKGVATVALGMTASAAFAAQEAADPAVATLPASEGGDEAGEIIVTGSRIRGVAPVGSAIISVGVDDIVQSGSITAAQALQELPQVFNLGVSENSRGQAGGSGNATYGTAINIRGISPYATLTLVNGHRMPLSGTLGQAVDPSVIPTVALQRIEVVADGASAIYGSDAVAGVVNLIMRRGYEGLEARGRIGFANDYTERQLSVLAGHKWATGSITLAYEHAYQSGLNGAERDFFRADQRGSGGRDYRLTQCSPGTIVSGGVNYAIPTGGVTPATAGSLVPGTRNLCDILSDQDLIPRQNRHSVSLAWQQSIGAVELSGDGYYSQREFRFRGAQTTASLFVPVTNPFFVTPPGAEAAVAAAGGLTVNYSLRDDLGRYNTTTGKVKSFGGSVKAEVALSSNWRAEVQGFIGRDESNARQFRLNSGALNAALRSTDPATSFNPFGGPGTTQSVLNGLNTSLFFPDGINEVKQVQANIDGKLFSLPGGDVRLAVGVEYIHAFSVFNFISGPRTAPQDRFARKSRSIKAAYAELLVPLIGPESGIPGVQSLELNLAGRYEDYSDVGSTTNPKIGVNWTVVEGLKLRGSYGTSFRAPLLSDLQTATAALTVQNYSDPTAVGGTTIGVAQSGGNPNLQPEEATTYSFGADLTPAALPGLSLSVNYFHINYSNQIAQYLSDLSILQRESIFASLITRNPSPEFIAQIASNQQVNGVIPAVPLLYVDGRLLNLGKSISEGVDFTASYAFSTNKAGDFRIFASGTKFTKYNVQITPTAPVIDALDTIFNPLDFRARGGISWKIGGLNSSIIANHVGSYRNDRITPNEKIKSFTTVDLHFDYTINNSDTGLLNGVSFGLDITNLFDRDPPYVNIAPGANGGGGFDPTAASPLGRLVSFTLGKAF
jgi:iron complex outermembrane receptor protein